MSSADALMIGTGEYTTGYVHGSPADSDKSAGVVALTLFDLRRRGQLGTLKMAGTNGTKFPGIRAHLEQAIGQTYRDLDTSFESFPADHVSGDATAYRTALETMKSGDLVIIFTPDDTHFQIAMDAVAAGCHVLIAKPIVKTIREHQALAKAADKAEVLVAMEVHKRWDPIYLDARDRIRRLGGISFFTSYMSQPKSQLETFRAWAGRSSDISYYLNAHHIDFHAWTAGNQAQPHRLFASASTGVAKKLGIDTEDVITLTVDWHNPITTEAATGVYTSSWIAPKSDVHSQQRFFCACHDGEVTVDQAHRGYSLATDRAGFASANPLFMKYTPDEQGYFCGQNGYGYRSIEAFVEAARSISRGESCPDDYRTQLASVQDTLPVTAILEAGRLSLDQGGCTVDFRYDDNQSLVELAT